MERLSYFVKFLLNAWTPVSLGLFRVSTHFSSQRN